MPWYEVDEDGDRILSDAPALVVKRTKTARLKAMKEADPESYGLPMDDKSVRRRRYSREEMERAEAKRIARRVIPEGSIGVPTVKMSTSLYSVEPALPDPRDKSNQPVEPTYLPDIPKADSPKLPVHVDATSEQILSVVSRQIDIFAGQIEIMKTLVHK